jgi:sensor histidine kinase regulating citrate/malate metabolism
MYLQREEILDKLNEGIFVVNENLQIIYKNLPAKNYIKEENLTETSPIYAEIMESLRTNLIISWSMIELQEKSFLVSLVPLRPLENLDAVMVILRNRTEFVNLTEQLTGLNHIIDALRANTHEFRNKLHVISGFLQLGENDKAMEFISEAAAEKHGQNILRLIQDKTIAALLIGKVNRAEELNIDFELRRDSYLPEKNSFLTSKELTIIVGNLIENSFEAIGDKISERQVEIFINVNEQGLTIIVDDTGGGMTADEIQKISGGSYTTKGAGHGYGMKLIREIVERHKGFLQIDSEAKMGTSITVNIFQRNC